VRKQDDAFSRRFVLMATGLLVLGVVSGGPASSATASIAGSGTITRILTDFEGLWDSTADAKSAPGGVSPNDTHHLLAFELDGTLWSTGVDDDALNEPFTPGTWQALPVEGLPTSGGNFYLYVRGAGLPRGDVQGPFSSSDLSEQLTRGIRGLDLASGLANIPLGSIIEFNVPAIASAAVGDGVPDILITQIANPLGPDDTLQFVDGSGNPVGDSVSIDQNAITALVGTWNPQFWTIPSAGTSTVASGEYPLRLRAFELSEFGLTAGNVGSVAKLVWSPSGTSDPAFFAYNTASLSAFASSLDVVTPTVTLAPIDDRRVADGAVATSATSSAGLTISYTTADPSICTVDASGSVTPLAVGTCTVTASTASQTVGSTAYTQASDSESFEVLAPAPTVPDPGPAPSPSPAAPVSSFVAPGGVLPALAPNEAEFVRADGTVAPLRIESTAPGALTYRTEGLVLTLQGTEASGVEEGLLARSDGILECTVCAELAVGTVIEVWAFSTPRLVAAWEVNHLPCQQFAIPLGAPLDGGGALTPGPHTLQLVLQTSSGVAAVNAGVTAEGPVPARVPAGDGPWVTDLATVVVVAAVLILAFSVASRRRSAERRLVTSR
jgi:hypothetical protein